MRPQPESSTREVLAGLVERVTFHNSENGFCVLRAKVRGHRDVVTVVGHAATIAAGEWITASGEWVNDRTHGQTSSRPHRTGCARLTASGRSRRQHSRGLGRTEAYGKSWFSCTATVSARRGRYGFSRLMAPTPSRS